MELRSLAIRVKPTCSVHLTSAISSGEAAWYWCSVSVLPGASMFITDLVGELFPPVTVEAVDTDRLSSSSLTGVTLWHKAKARTASHSLQPSGRRILLPANIIGLLDSPPLLELDTLPCCCCCCRMLPDSFCIICPM